MADDDDVLVLRDGTGRYYLLPRATLEALAVPEAERGRLEAALGGADVAGFDAGPAFQYRSLGQLPGEDIMALSFLVIMEAAKSAQEDLKAIMRGVKAINTGGRYPP
ncbi:MAG TPA: hypothetical protein VFO85_19210 [Vicinamibacteria bacterium]|nr:hypothetical protein [Vicinamibacteria bacterium]